MELAYDTNQTQLEQTAALALATAQLTGKFAAQNGAVKGLNVYVNRVANDAFNPSALGFGQ